MSPGDVPITPQQPGRNGRAPLGTVTHSPHQLRKGETARELHWRGLCLQGIQTKILSRRTLDTSRLPPPLDNCSRFSAKSDSSSPANPGMLHTAFAVRAPGCRVPCWPMLPPSMSCKKNKGSTCFFPFQRRTAATSVACSLPGSTTLEQPHKPGPEIRFLRAKL